LALVVLGSFFLQQQTVLNQVESLVAQAVPISRSLIRQNLEQVLKLRGTVGIVALISAIWSGSGVFTTLSQNINRAWTNAPPRNFLQSRLIALGMVGTLAVLLGLSVLSTAVLNVLQRLQVPIAGGIAIYHTPLWTIISIGVPWLFIFVLFVALYRFAPNEEVPWRAAIWAGLIVALVWQGAAYAFAWYAGSPFARYQLVYGSLATVVVLMFWTYLSSWITLFGAHLSASIARGKR
jgi:membrane protein